MSGGAYERTAAYIANLDDNLTIYGSSLVNGEAKTKNVYAMGSEDTSLANYNANMSKYGDAVYETSSGTYNASGDSNIQSWYADFSVFLYSTTFFTRGGGYSSATGAGVFYFNYNSGSYDGIYSFRPVLVVN